MARALVVLLQAQPQTPTSGCVLCTKWRCQIAAAKCGQCRRRHELLALLPLPRPGCPDRQGGDPAQMLPTLNSQRSFTHQATNPELASQLQTLMQPPHRPHTHARMHAKHCKPAVLRMHEWQCRRALVPSQPGKSPAQWLARQQTPAWAWQSARMRCSAASSRHLRSASASASDACHI